MPGFFLMCTFSKGKGLRIRFLHRFMPKRLIIMSRLLRRVKDGILRKNR